MRDTRKQQILILRLRFLPLLRNHIRIIDKNIDERLLAIPMNYPRLDSHIPLLVVHISQDNIVLNQILLQYLALFELLLEQGLKRHGHVDCTGIINFSHL